MLITEHAYLRASERLSLSRDSLNKLSERALNSGLSASNFKHGKFKRYLDHLYFKYRKANNIKIYGDVIYLFRNKVLITLYQLPNEFKKAVVKVGKRGS